MKLTNKEYLSKLGKNLKLMETAITDLDDAIYHLTKLDMNVPCVKERIQDIAEIRSHILQVVEFAAEAKGV